MGNFYRAMNQFHETLEGINPVVTNELSHPYHWDESIFILRDIRSNFSFLFHFDEKYVRKQNSPRLDAAFCGVISWVFCLHMSHKKDVRLILVNLSLPISRNHKLSHWHVWPCSLF